MPLTYSVDTAYRVVRVTCGAPMTFQEVVDHFRSLREDPAIAGQLDFFVDVSAADLLLPTSQLNEVTSQLGALRAKAQFRIVAILATRDVVFGIMRMLSVMAGQHFLAIQVFRDRVEAEAWLATKRLEAEQGGSSTARHG